MPVSGGLSWTAAISRAMSLQIGMQQQWSRGKIEKEIFSPYFLYDLLPKASSSSCRLRPDWMKQTQQLLVTTGNVKFSDYSFHTIDCNRRPSPQLINSVERCQVRSFTKLFFSDQSDKSASIGEKQFIMKRSLGRNHPVVVCMLVDQHFNQMKTDTWSPKFSSGKSRFQAVVVVGYDDNRQAFEVSNSAGKNWGKGGFAWIRYQDLIYAKYGFELIFGDQPMIAKKNHVNKTIVNQPTIAHKKSAKPGQPKSQPAKPAPMTNEVSEGVAQMVSLHGSLLLNEVNSNGDFTEVRTTGNAKGFYELTKKYAVFSQFQMIGSSTKPGSYVYVLSVDPRGKAELHYPYRRSYGLGVSDVVSPVIPDEQSQIVIPEPSVRYDESGNQVRKDQVFTKEYAGTDWLITLYSDRRLDREITDLLSDLQGHNKDFPSRFQSVFGKFMIPDYQVRHERDLMKFETKLLSKAYVVPVILKIEGN